MSANPLLRSKLKSRSRLLMADVASRSAMMIRHSAEVSNTSHFARQQNLRLSGIPRASTELDLVQDARPSTFQARPLHSMSFRVVFKSSTGNYERSLAHSQPENVAPRIRGGIKIRSLSTRANDTEDESTPGPSATTKQTDKDSTVNDNDSHFASKKDVKTSPFAPSNKSRHVPIPGGRRKMKFVPRKAPVHLTPKARNLFKQLLSNAPNPETVGIMLNYKQSSTGEPRMVFTFGFVAERDLTEDDEGVSLEVLEDGKTPKSPVESQNDGLPKLYVHHNAFMKVLGATLDVEIEESGNFKPLLYDREGNLMDPNA